VFLASPTNGAQQIDDNGLLRFHEDITFTTSESVRVQVPEPIKLQVEGTVNGSPAHGETILNKGAYTLGAETTLSVKAGTAVPVVDGAPNTNDSWLKPQQNGLTGLFETYSLIFATFLGTMGLPHVLVRFYTNPRPGGPRCTCCTCWACSTSSRRSWA
jgi:hypothetical protein